MNRQSSPVIVREGVHDVDLYLSLHGGVLAVYRLSFCRGPLVVREWEVVEGYGGFPRGVVVFPCLFVPILLDLLKCSQVSRRWT